MAKNKTIKNVLVFICNQLRFDALGCYGLPLGITPNIDNLAKGGIRFEKAYCSSPKRI